jgi:hypothetical protein
LKVTTNLLYILFYHAYFIEAQNSCTNAGGRI